MPFRIFFFLVSNQGTTELRNSVHSHLTAHKSSGWNNTMCSAFSGFFIDMGTFAAFHLLGSNTSINFSKHFSGHIKCFCTLWEHIDFIRSLCHIWSKILSCLLIFNAFLGCIPIWFGGKMPSTVNTLWNLAFSYLQISFTASTDSILRPTFWLFVF